MPEGHLVHRTAEQLRRDLVGQHVTVTSPQGRFPAAGVDGQVLESAEAYGKHLLLGFERAVVHVHLGMRGLWLRYDDVSEPPKRGVRMRLAGSVAYDLIAPASCQSLGPAEVEALVARLGPDPLRDEGRNAEAARRLRASSQSVGAALLEQAIWAGIGNAWRAELLWLERLHPRTPASRLSSEAAASLWQTASRYMTLGRDTGQVVSDPDVPNERWVYKRHTCRSCGEFVATQQIGGRTAYWCPREQNDTETD